MEFEDALAFELENIVGLGDKVFPGFSPGRPAPYLVYISSDGKRDKALSGYLGTRRVEVELGIVTVSYGQLKPLIKAVINKLISFEGRVIGVDGPEIQELTYQEPVERYEELPKLWRGIIDFVIYF